ncbi:MAG: monofunctional biosynthetic peptidoglycan transglycosylase [Gammaproteobacteria bacterium]
MARRNTRKYRQRLRRGLLWGLAAFVLLSVLPIVALRWLPPPTTAVMLQRTLSEGRTQDYQWRPIERISPQIALAVVASEDQKFPRHWGFDLAALRDAVQAGARGERLRGASTLTQQVARNLFLWQGRSYLRKALEAWISVWLEILWPKQRILEVYLNIAETGDHTFGVEAAAQRYFGRPAERVSREQAALLAAVLPSPRRYQAARPSAFVLQQRDRVLQQMSQLGGVAYLGDILPAPE